MALTQRVVKPVQRMKAQAYFDYDVCKKVSALDPGINQAYPLSHKSPAYCFSLYD